MLTTCTFQHPVFAKLGEVAFRPTEADRTPALIISMGQATAALPLASLQHELNIEDGSPDGVMLAQVAKSLDFVGELRPGDRLPVEVLCGAASWAPDPVHRDIAQARLNLQLTSVFDDAAGPDGPLVGASWAAASPPKALAAMRVPGMDLRLQAATIELAATLGLPDAAAARELLEGAAHELSFIEALRARLLDRVARMCGQIEALAQGVANNLSGLELISRVRCLAGIGLARIGARFADLEAQTSDVRGLLQGMAEHRAVIRLHRDWLYSSLRAWEGVLAAWEAAGLAWTDATWPLLSQTYRFLALRFMPTQEWLATRARRPAGAAPARMVW